MIKLCTSQLSGSDWSVWVNGTVAAGGLHCAADKVSSLSVESKTILKSC